MIERQFFIFCIVCVIGTTIGYCVSEFKEMAADPAMIAREQYKDCLSDARRISDEKETKCQLILDSFVAHPTQPSTNPLTPIKPLTNVGAK